MTRKTRHIAIFISFSGQGGVEKMITNLAAGLLEEGCRVDMVIARAKGEHLEAIPEGIRQIRFGKKHTLSSLPDLIGYLKREEPDALLAVKDRAIKVAVIARRLAGYRGRLVGRIGTTVSEAISGKGSLRRRLWFTGMRWFYPSVDRIVAVSEGVAEDILSITGLPPGRVTVIRNPVVTPGMLAASSEAVDHPWFRDGQSVPVIMGMGRLTEQKDFKTLIRAFGEVREAMPCRLVVLGEGGMRPELEKLAASLGLKEVVALPGFVKNPYAWLARASLFVLSSRWEGSPNALTEALALGRPVVSTDCPSGPREILKGGEYGILVPMGDIQAMADAIRHTLAAPPDSDFLRSAVTEYSVQSSARSYLGALGFGSSPAP